VNEASGSQARQAQELSLPVYYCTPHGNVLGHLLVHDTIHDDAGVVSGENDKDQNSTPTGQSGGATYRTLFFYPKKSHDRNGAIFEKSQLPYQYFEASIDLRDLVNIGKLRSYSDQQALVGSLDPQHLARQGATAAERSTSMLQGLGNATVEDKNNLPISLQTQYLFDYYLQLDLACVNGNFLAPEDSSRYKKSKIKTSQSAQLL